MIYLQKISASLLLLLFVVFSGVDGQPSRLTSLKENITNRISNGPLVGVAVAYINPDGETSYFTAGTRSVDDSAEVTNNSIFQIASVTKVFTALALSKLLEERSIGLEQTANSLLGNDFSLPTYKGKEITLKHLITHTSGLPRLPNNLKMSDPQNPYKNYSKKELKEFLRNHELQRAPGSSYQYSNLGIAIVGHILVEQLGMDYDNIIKNHIAEPLGLSRTGMQLGDVDNSTVASGHYQGATVPKWDFSIFEAMGGLQSSITDLGRFVKAHIRHESSIVDALSMVQKPLFDVEQSSKLIDKIGMGWMLSTQQDSIWWHNGRTSGFSSFVGFNTETSAGVAVLGNAHARIDDIGLYLLDSRHQLKKLLAVEELKKFVGQYKSSGGISYYISRQKSQLYVQRPGQPKFPIFKKSENRFYLEAVPAEIEFTLDEGTIQELILHQNGQKYRAAKQN
jgi:CubicO group peptidase (beta-lactamase class C family)